MKSLLKVCVFFTILGLLSIIIYNVIRKANYKQNVIQNIQNLPNFSLKNTNNILFTQENIAQKKPIVFIYFNTECDFCQYEVKSIKKHIEKFKDITLIFISPEPIKEIAKFAEYNELAGQHNIVFLQDSILDFATQIDANIIPSILIYNKDRKLIKRNKGQLKIDSIFKIIENEN